MNWAFILTVWQIDSKMGKTEARECLNQNPPFPCKTKIGNK